MSIRLLMLLLRVTQVLIGVAVGFVLFGFVIHLTKGGPFTANWPVVTTDALVHPLRAGAGTIRIDRGVLALASSDWRPELAQLLFVLAFAVGAIFALQILISAFFAILFLQSGIDKVVDRQGNLQWLIGHFAKSPLAGMVPLLLSVIAIMELGAGVLSAIGCILILVGHDSTIAFYGVLLAGLALLALFFGQRMAKEYAGAAVLVPYFLVVIAGVIWLGQG
jgi:diacylglycerol kinase